MSKQGKILLGIVSFLPIVLIVIYAVFFFSMFATVLHESIRQTGPPAFLLGNMNELQITMSLLVISSLGLLIYYLIHAMNNTRLERTDRLVWLFFLLLANVAAYPVYWYMQVWKGPETTAYHS